MTRLCSSQEYYIQPLADIACESECLLILLPTERDRPISIKSFCLFTKNIFNQLRSEGCRFQSEKVSQNPLRSFLVARRNTLPVCRSKKEKREREISSLSALWSSLLGPPIFSLGFGRNCALRTRFSFPCFPGGHKGLLAWRIGVLRWLKFSATY